MYNVLIGGAAGEGIDTVASVFERALKSSGYHVFTVRDFMSRVRGGHNFTQVRFGAERVATHIDALDGIIALDQATIDLHIGRLGERGFVLCDASAKTEDPRAIKLDAVKIATDLGNPKAASSVSIGAALKMLGEEASFAAQVMLETMKPSIVEVNLEALKAGYGLAEARFTRLGTKTGFAGEMLVSGNECLALGALAGGLRFYSGYPMSPSTSIMAFLEARALEAQVVVEQAEDEIAAVNMVLGASYAGVRSLVATSGGGFCLMVEALGFSGIAEIPVVLADIQRPGPATGFPTRTEQADLKFVISAAQGEFPRMVIALRNHEDAFYQTARALDIADRYQIPVILLGDQYLADATTCVPIFDFDRLPKLSEGEAVLEEEDGSGYLRYKLTESGVSPRLIPGRSDEIVCIDSDEHDERGHITESASVRIAMVDKRAAKLKGLSAELQEPVFLGSEGCKTLLVGFGSTWGAIAESVETLNKKEPGGYGALVFGDVWPLPTRELTGRARQAERIVNVEQNSTGQLASLVRERTGIVCGESILKYDGRQIRGEEIVARLQGNGG